MAEQTEAPVGTENGQPQNGQPSQQSLGTAAARNLATTTKSVPQMQGITSRWLLRILHWVEASGGTYRVNRRLSYAVGDGRVTCSVNGGDVKVIPAELREIPLLRDLEDDAVLEALAGRFHQEQFTAGQTIVERGKPADHLVLIAHGRVNKVGEGKYGERAHEGVLADGDYFGDRVLATPDVTWDHTLTAATGVTVLVLHEVEFQELMDDSEVLKAHVEAYLARPEPEQDEHGEAAVAMRSGHVGEPDLPPTFVDYEGSPREYELSVAQTVLRVHTRVADLFNQPMNQVEQQLRLTIEALRERQEHEMINNREIGLLHNADFQQRAYARTGPPTPDDMDELLALVWKEPACFLAHPRAIAAFGRECSVRGIYPQGIELNGHQVPAWRGIPILPCNKIPISGARTSSILLLRTGEQNQGVIGLHQTGIPDEYQPGLSVRFMGISEKAIISYLVSAYYSVAVLVPDALAVLEEVDVGRFHDDAGEPASDSGSAGRGRRRAR